MSRFVTVSIHETSLEAHINRSLLLSHEIDAFIKGEHDHYSMLYPTNSYEVQVRKEDADEAREILKKISEEDNKLRILLASAQSAVLKTLKV